MSGTVVARGADAVNPKLPTGEVELAVDELAVQSAAETLPAAGGRRRRVPRGDAPPLSLPRPPAREAAPQHRAPLAGDREHPAAHDRGRLHRVPDAHPHLELAGGRARLPGAEPHASREVLRAAAGAPAVQAAPDGGGLRPLLPDRARASATRTAAPTARRASSTSSTSRCRSSPRRTCGRPSSRCSTASSRSSRRAAR